MWIRSQDKTQLINLNEGLYICKRYNNSSEPIFQIENMVFVAGQYSTEEKALNVLDMIEEYLNKNKMLNRLGYLEYVKSLLQDYKKEDVQKEFEWISLVFQMPLDEEVES